MKAVMPGLLTSVVLVSGCAGYTHVPTATVTVTSPIVLATPSAQPSTDAAPKPAVPKSAMEGDGTYVVGIDIRPGTYRTTGGNECYWARLRSLNTGDIIDNNNSSGPQVVEIKPTDRAFLTHDCQQWVAEYVPAQPVPSVPSGVPVAPATSASEVVSSVLACSYRTALAIRTALSEVAVCDDGTGSFTYKGLRLKDNARIDLPGAIQTATGFMVTNNNTRYEVSRSGLVMYANGEVYPETAIASGP